MSTVVNLDVIHKYVNDLVTDIVSWWWLYLTEISWQVLITITAYICVCVFLCALLKRIDHKSWQLPGPPSRLLLVTAHPDDEVMFFGPMIYWLTQYNACQVHLLCFSMGN